MTESSKSEVDANSSAMTFGEHLEELRACLGKAILATLIVTVGILFFHNEVMQFVVRPYQAVARELKIQPRLMVTSPTASFFAHVKVSLVVGLLFAAPFWLYQFWRFIGVGLYKTERRWVYRAAPMMLLLFAAGVAFGFTVLIPVGLRYLLSFGDPDIVGTWIGLSEYLSLFTLLTLVLGLTFELPIVMGVLSKVGLFTPRTFREKRRYFILGAFIVAAILTPPDVVTQCLMAAPMMILYEFGIFLSWVMAEDEDRVIDWKLWRRRLSWILVIVGLLFVTQDMIRSGYQERRVRARLLASSDEGVVPYYRILADCHFLGFKQPTLVYRISEGDETELLGVWTEGHSEVVQLEFVSDRLSKTSEVKSRARFQIQQGVETVVVDLTETMPGSSIIPKVLADLRVVGVEESVQLEAFLADLVGHRPEGASSLSAGNTRAEVQTTVDAWSTWWDQHPDWVYMRRSER